MAGADGIGLNWSGSSSFGAALPGATDAEPVIGGLVGLGAGCTIGSGGFAPAPALDAAVGAAGLGAADLVAAGLGAALVVDARLLVFGLDGADDAALSSASDESSGRLGFRGVAGGSITKFLHRPDRLSGLIVCASHGKS